MSNVPQVSATIGAQAYTVTLSDGRHQWLADEPTDLGGADVGPNPFELLLSALGACTCATLRMYADRKGWPLQRVDVQLALNPNGAPTGGNAIQRDIELHGPLDAPQRERLLQIANACPVHKLLTGTVTIATRLEDPEARA